VAEVERDFAGLCAIARQAHAEGSVTIVQMALELIEACRERWFWLRVGVSFGWELAEQLQQGKGEFSDREWDRLREVCELRDLQQHW
jgi:hypothetical protein